MRKVLIAALFFSGLVLSCSDDQDKGANCYHGRILDYDCCLGVTPISLDVRLSNSKTVKVGGTSYPNVIVVPGHLESPSGSEIFVTLRGYDAEKDSHLLDGLCLCITITNLPTHVITSSSPTECP